MDVVSRFSFATGDSSPVELVNPFGRAPIALTCEHGGRTLPAALVDQAPPPDDMARHIAWDVGAAALARGLARRLDAALAIQPYSRLVVDCNRPRHAADLAPPVSDGTEVPFNRGLDAAEIDARWQAIHQPYHRAVSGLINARNRPALVAIHSFTPRLRAGAPRRMHAGMLARRDVTLAGALRDALLSAAPDLSVAVNEPYRIEDDSDYTIPVHGEARGLPHVLVEIRNDLIADAQGVDRWTGLLADSLKVAVPQVIGKP
jgi:predicted N-formylglutamate amidohydrolase